MPDKPQVRCAGIVAAGLLLLFTGPAGIASQEPGNAPLFDRQDTLDIRIEGPLSTLMRERSNTKYLNGKISYADNMGTIRELDLKFRTRGNYRRQRSTCRFPPVRLRLAAQQVVDTEFAGQKNLKLVSHCSPTRGTFEQLVLKEYLAYRILQLHTPYSFRSRLLRINWVDTDQKNSATEKYGFVIEHKSQLAERLNMTVSAVQGTRYSKLDPGQTAIASVFQYLIGNTDFSIVKGPADSACCHNSILVSGTDTALFPIPYDFDFAGIVDAPYAEPDPRFRIRRVTRRVYRGHCSVNPELVKTISLFADKQQAVLDLIASQEGLTEKNRKRVLKFVQGFYDKIADQNRAVQFLSKECS